ncbi:MAG: hypothetical protein OXB93_04790 [Cytophagales bacterium]|nr:hypothetical protein [Cytophagales bacterium]
MTNLKNIVKQLSEDAYKSLHGLLKNNGAEKSAHLLCFLRERKATDMKLMNELRLSTNAYYTLRSRLGQKIDEYLINRIEGSRTRILRKVYSIHDMIFTQKPTLATATLKKLEKDLLYYDMPHELAIVYKYLKKLQLHSADTERYERHYHEQISKGRTLDKMENLLSDYFKIYGKYYLSHQEKEKRKLIRIEQDMEKLSLSYPSHRLYVYASLGTIFHRLYTLTEEEYHQENKNDSRDVEALEDKIQCLEQHLNEFAEDPVYHHLKYVLAYLKLSYFHQYGTFKKTEEAYQEIEPYLPYLLNNYKAYTFSEHALFIGLRYHIRNRSTALLSSQKRDSLLANYEVYVEDTPHYLATLSYRVLCEYYDRDYSKAIKLIDQFMRYNGLRMYPRATIELRVLLCLQYVMLNEKEKAQQLIRSLQRKIRTLPSEPYIESINQLIRLLKIPFGNKKNQRKQYLLEQSRKISFPKTPNYSPLSFIELNEDFVHEIFRLKTKNPF